MSLNHNFLKLPINIFINKYTNKGACKLNILIVDNPVTKKYSQVINNDWRGKFHIQK